MLTNVLLFTAGAVIGALLALIAGLIVAARDADDGWPDPPETTFLTWTGEPINTDPEEVNRDDAA